MDPDERAAGPGAASAPAAPPTGTRVGTGAGTRAGTQRRPATDAEARALASSLRLRILRMCLDEPMTNAQLAERLGRPPASVLHHVRTLVGTGFLEALPAQQGVRGSRPRPYRATGKSWLMEHPTYTNRPMVEAFVAESALVATEELTTSRLGLRLDDTGYAELQDRLHEVLQDFAARPPTPGGRPWSVFLSVHPDPDRD
ncbi:ArsR/SmtB family transcription factor [Jannaschia sp. R86511]|uniref:ArsR/SmtB family transcription factor n=1 Tax=Jannaschia sp. R86511 TaxID=3093853 RepID=UPI0036D25540